MLTALNSSLEHDRKDVLVALKLLDDSIWQGLASFKVWRTHLNGVSVTFPKLKSFFDQSGAEFKTTASTNLWRLLLGFSRLYSVTCIPRFWRCKICNIIWRKYVAFENFSPWQYGHKNAEFESPGDSHVQKFLGSCKLYWEVCVTGIGRLNWIR